MNKKKSEGAETKALNKKHVAIFAKYLELKRATTTANIALISNIVFDLLTVIQDGEYVLNAEDLDVVFDHLGYDASYITMTFEKARDEVHSLNIK